MRDVLTRHPEFSMASGLGCIRAAECAGAGVRKRRPSDEAILSRKISNSFPLHGACPRGPHDWLANTLSTGAKRFSAGLVPVESTICLAYRAV